jgi:hypothetical protein
MPCTLAAFSACGVILLEGAGNAGTLANDAAAGFTEG